jgi:hypothetical protein
MVLREIPQRDWHMDGRGEEAVPLFFFLLYTHTHTHQTPRVVRERSSRMGDKGLGGKSEEIK